MAPWRVGILLAVAMVLIWPAAVAMAQQPQITISPASVVVAPGQSVQMSAQVTGIPTPYRLGWSLRGPRYAGADWGRLTAQGLYTAPMSPPTGQVFIVATVYGTFGIPWFSQSVPVSFTAGGVYPVPPVQRPTVTPPTRPAPTAPPIARLNGYLRATSNKCQAAWNRSLVLGPDADTSWSQLSLSEKVSVVGSIATERLGRNIAIQVLPPDLNLTNVARVTNDGSRTKWTFGMVPGGPANGVLDLSLTQGPGFDIYPSLYAFLCYETEIVRIRARLQPSCTRSFYRDVKTSIDAMTIYSDKSRQAAAYATFMQGMRARYPGDEGKHMAASWLFEKIVVKGGVDSFAGATPCDLEPQYGSAALYNLYLSPSVTFEHDSLALQRGKQG